MRRGDVYWADLGSPAGRRPVLVVTRTIALRVLNKVTVAPISRTVRGNDAEVAVGHDEGLPATSAASCDNLMTIPIDWLDPRPAGRLAGGRVPDLDRALRFALEIVY